MDENGRQGEVFVTVAHVEPLIRAITDKEGSSTTQPIGRFTLVSVSSRQAFSSRSSPPASVRSILFEVSFPFNRLCLVDDQFVG